MPDRDEQDCSSQGDINEEDPMPRSMLGQPSAKDRAKSGRHCRESGPRPDSFTTRIFVKNRTDDGETTRHQECSGDTLHRAPQHQFSYAERKSTANRSNCETSYAAQKHGTSAERVSKRSADQNQSGKKQSVRLNDPLDIYHGGVKLRLQCRQSYVDGGAVNECHARSENRGGKHPPARSL